MPTIAQLAAQQIHDRLSKTDLPASTYQPAQPGPVKGAIGAVGNAINPLSPTNLPSRASAAANNFFMNLQNHIATMGSDALNTLVVNPATRIAQLGVQTANEFQNPGYDTSVNSGNPQRANAGGTATPLPVNAAAPGVNTSNSGANLAQPQTTLGQTVAPLQNGTAGAKQIVGQALKAGSLLAAPELSEGAVGAPTLAGKVFGGAGAGYVLGATGGAGEDLANNPNSNAQSVTQSAQSGANQGAVVGGVLGGAGGLLSGNGEVPTEAPKTGTSAVHNEYGNEYAKITPEQQAHLNNERENIPYRTGKDAPQQVHLTPLTKLEGGASTAKEISLDEFKAKYPDAKTSLDKMEAQNSAASTDKITQSRINDATPTYSKDMVGANVRDANGKIVPRIASEGKGLTGERPVTVSASEQAAGKELANIKDYPDKGTALEKSLSVQKAISSEAEGMRGSLQTEDKSSPLDATKEKAKVTDLVKSNLPKDIKEKLGYMSPADEAKMTPTQKTYREALISQQEEVLPKTAAGRYYQKVLDAVKEYDGTREGKLNLRQGIDNAYKNARGKLAFGSDSQNAIDEVNTDIRDAINKDLKESTQNTDTQASLDKQTNLYRAKDVLDTKAQTESPTRTGRYGQRHPIQKTMGRRLGMREAASIGATAAGLTYATSAINKAIKNTASGK